MLYSTLKGDAVNNSNRRNHVEIIGIGQNRRVYLDGRELLLDNEDDILITGYDSADDLTRARITLLSPRVTITDGPYLRDDNGITTLNGT